MRRRVPGASLLLLLAMLATASSFPATAAVPATAVHAGPAMGVHAIRAAAKGGPGTWTKIAKVDTGFAYPGLFRTSDGKLHVLWRKQLQNHNFAYGYTTVALNGATGAT